MNKKVQTKFGPYPFLVILLTAVACTLRTVATFLGVDDFGYFNNSILFHASAWIVIAVIAILLTLPLAYRKRQDTLVDQTTPHTFFPSMLLGMLFLFFVGDGVFSLMNDVFLPTIDKLVYLLTLLLSLLSCIYFFSLAILESTTNDRKANLGMACVLFFGIYAAYLYLDVTISRNAHLELSEEMMYIALSLYFLYEVRISLGKQRQSLYVMFSMIAGVLVAFNTIPTLIYYIASGELLASSFAGFLLSLGVLVFILLRHALFEKSPMDAPIPLVERLVKLARVREDDVKAIENRYIPNSSTSEATVEELQATEEVEEIESSNNVDVFDEDTGEEGIEACDVIEETVGTEENVETILEESTNVETDAPVDDALSGEEGERTTESAISEPWESEHTFLLPMEEAESTLAPFEGELENLTAHSEPNEPKEE